MKSQNSTEALVYLSVQKNILHIPKCDMLNTFLLGHPSEAGSSKVSELSSTVTV